MTDTRPATVQDLYGVMDIMIKRFNAIDEKLSAHDERFDKIDGRFSDIDGQLDVITTTIKAHDGQLDVIATAVLRHDEVLDEHTVLLKRIDVHRADNEDRIGTLERSVSRLRLRSS